MLELIRLSLLQTQQFEGWRDLPAHFYLEPVGGATFNLVIRAMPGHRMQLTEDDLTLRIREQVNSMQTDFILGEGLVISGGPEGGVIRFSFKRNK